MQIQTFQLSEKNIYRSNNRNAYNQVTQITHLNFEACWIYLPICNPNKFALDHCESLEWPVIWSVIWHLLTQNTLGTCKTHHEHLFIVEIDDYILHILMLLGILSSVCNIVAKIKKMIIPWMKAQLTQERKLILARVSRCKNISITRALLRKAIIKVALFRVLFCFSPNIWCF